MKIQNEKNWIDILKSEFEHPAIVLWRAVELKTLSIALTRYHLEKPILDIGCAEGKVADLLFQGEKLFGLDNCWQLLKENKNRKAYKALLLADGCQMPYKNGSFGTVFSNCVIEHIPSLDNLLNEASRVLKEGGFFIYTVPSHKFGEFLFFSTIFYNLGLKRIADWYGMKRNKMLNHFHCHGHNRWDDILRSKGFHLIEYRYYMAKELTCVWDLLAVLVFTLRFIWPINYFLPLINKSIISKSKIYYHMNSEIGSGLLLIAQKGA